MRVEKGQMLEIWAPEWFADPKFAEWVRTTAESCPGRSRLATWHTGKEMTDTSDVFLGIDNYEVQEEDMPPHIAEMISAEALTFGMKYGIVWLKNFSHETEPTLRHDTQGWINLHRDRIDKIIEGAQKGWSIGWNLVYNLGGSVVAVRITCERGYIDIDESFNVSMGNHNPLISGG